MGYFVKFIPRSFHLCRQIHRCPLERGAGGAYKALGSVRNLTRFACSFLCPKSIHGIWTSRYFQTLYALPVRAATAHCVGGVVLKRRPRLTFCVNVKPWSHSDICPDCSPLSTSVLCRQRRYQMLC